MLLLLLGNQKKFTQFENVVNLGIPTVTILDSNCDPTLADWFIPANDDSVSALRLVLGSFEEAIVQGKKKFQERETSRNTRQQSQQVVRKKSNFATLQPKSQ